MSSTQSHRIGPALLQEDREAQIASMAVSSFAILILPVLGMILDQ